MNGLEIVNALLAKCDAIDALIESARDCFQELEQCGNCSVYDSEPNVDGDGYCLGNRFWTSAGHQPCEDWEAAT